MGRGIPKNIVRRNKYCGSGGYGCGGGSVGVKIVEVGVVTCGEGFDHITIVREGRVPPAPAKKGRKKGGRRWAEEREI